jgi:hypothetical protein
MENTELSEQKAVSNFRTSSFKWGGIGAAIVIIYTVILYVIDSTLMVNPWAGLFGVVGNLATQFFQHFYHVHASVWVKLVYKTRYK